MRLALARALFVKVGLRTYIVMRTLTGPEAVVTTARRALQPQCASLFKIITDISPCFTRALVDLNALAWLEDYLQTWQGTLLVVCVE